MLVKDNQEKHKKTPCFVEGGTSDSSDRLLMQELDSEFVIFVKASLLPPSTKFSFLLIFSNL